MAFDFVRKLSDSWTLQRDLDDVRAAAAAYVQEQTVKPVKDLGRYVQFGCLGSLFVGVGGTLVLVGILRLLQTSSSVFHGHLSWVPYLIVASLGMIALGVIFKIISSGPAKRRRDRSGS